YLFIGFYRFVGTVVLNEMFIFNEAVSIIKLVLIVILLLSIIALKWISKEA
ncbi:QacE family quaternary ammonium compound efflux SMR transporter, partial [Campylobacter jejuni]|nr:QacE family quaternary ammonium compound efflux SMR transporter [Campylobacter jejuni]